jgi:hypothetical protein
LPERSRQAGGVEGFDEVPRRADFSSRSGPEEAAELVMHRRSTVLRHRLEASEGGQLALSLEHALYGLGSQRADQLVLEIGDARKETERFKAPVGVDRDGRGSEGATDMRLAGSVVQAAKPRAWVVGQELNEQT